MPQPSTRDDARPILRHDSKPRRDLRRVVNTKAWIAVRAGHGGRPAGKRRVAAVRRHTPVRFANPIGVIAALAVTVIVREYTDDQVTYTFGPYDRAVRRASVVASDAFPIL